MSTDLVTLPPSAVALPGTFDQTGLSGASRLKPTSIILVQNTTRDAMGARPGQFLDLDTGAIYDQLRVVPLAISKPRVMFPPGADLDAEPICRSHDGIVPSSFVEHPQAKSCKGCPYSVWYDKKPPACKEKRNFVLWVKDTEYPSYFQVGGRSVSAAQWAIDYVNRDIFINRNKGLSLNLYDYSLTLSSDREKNSKGAYYVARFGDIKRVANPGEYLPVFTQFVVEARKYEQAEEQVVGAVQAEANTDAAVGEVCQAEFVGEV